MALATFRIFPRAAARPAFHGCAPAWRTHRRCRLRPGISPCRRRSRECNRRVCRAGEAGASRFLAVSRFSRRRSRSSARSIAKASRLSAWSGRRRASDQTGRAAPSRRGAAASGLVSFSLVCPWNCGSRTNTDSLAASVPSILCHQLCRPPVGAVLAPGAQALQQSGPEPCLMRAALCRWNRVAVRVQEALRLQPAARPFHAPGGLPVGRTRQVRFSRPGLGQRPPRFADVRRPGCPADRPGSVGRPRPARPPASP